MNQKIIDFYDDQNGVVLKRLMPEKAVIPEFVKTASPVSRDAHPNDFAVVMVDEGDRVPRFPITDPGNTWLSALYFYDRHDSLPGEVQKVAAVRIRDAMQHFDLPVLDVIEKIARDEQVDSNLVNVSGAPEPIVVHKTLQDSETRADVQYALERADGSRLYPLSNAENAATAAEYFDTHAHRFQPRERHEYAVKTAAALDRAGLPLTEKIASYGGEDYSNNLKGFMDVRYAYLINVDDGDAIERLHKIAATRGTVDPNTFAQNLEAFDRGLGLDAAWDAEIPDPWLSTFFSRPELLKTAGDEVFRVDTESCTGSELRQLAADGKALLKQTFDEKFVGSFCKEPVSVYKSMPKPQQVILCRLSRDFQTSSASA
jgi:hypothetical protein